jgi:hypothetical protein
MQFDSIPSLNIEDISRLGLLLCVQDEVVDYMMTMVMDEGDVMVNHLIVHTFLFLPQYSMSSSDTHRSLCSPSHILCPTNPSRASASLLTSLAVHHHRPPSKANHDVVACPPSRLLSLDGLELQDNIPLSGWKIISLPTIVIQSGEEKANKSFDRSGDENGLARVTTW